MKSIKIIIIILILSVNFLGCKNEAKDFREEKKIYFLHSILSIPKESVRKVSGQILDPNGNEMENSILTPKLDPQLGIPIPLLFIEKGTNRNSNHVVSRGNGEFDILLIPGKYSVTVQNYKQKLIGGFTIDLEKDSKFLQPEIWEESLFSLPGKLTVTNLSSTSEDIGVENEETNEIEPTNSLYLINPSFELDKKSCTKDDSSSDCPKGWTIASSGSIEIKENVVPAKDGNRVLTFSSLTSSYSGRLALSNCFGINKIQNVYIVGHILKSIDENVRGRFILRFYEDEHCISYTGTTLNGDGITPSMALTWEKIDFQVDKSLFPKSSSLHVKLGLQSSKPTGVSAEVYWDDLSISQK